MHKVSKESKAKSGAINVIARGVLMGAVVALLGTISSAYLVKAGAIGEEQVSVIGSLVRCVSSFVCVIACGKGRGSVVSVAATLVYFVGLLGIAAAFRGGFNGVTEGLITAMVGFGAGVVVQLCSNKRHRIYKQRMQFGRN